MHEALGFGDVAMTDVLGLYKDEEGRNGKDQDDPEVAEPASIDQQDGTCHKDEAAACEEDTSLSVLADDGVVDVL